MNQDTSGPDTSFSRKTNRYGRIKIALAKINSFYKIANPK